MIKVLCHNCDERKSTKHTFPTAPGHGDYIRIKDSYFKVLTRLILVGDNRKDAPKVEIWIEKVQFDYPFVPLGND